MDRRQFDEARHTDEQAADWRRRMELPRFRSEHRVELMLSRMREEESRDEQARLCNERCARIHTAHNDHEAGSSRGAVHVNPPLVAPPEVRRRHTEHPPRTILEEGRRWPVHHNPSLVPLPPNLLTEAEAHELIRTNTPVPAYCLIPEGWTRNMMNDVPVAPRLAGQARLDYIKHILTRFLGMCHTEPYWDVQVEMEYQVRLNSF